MAYPEAFLHQMQALLGDEYNAFLKSHSQPHHCGLRANTLKISPDALRSLLPFSLKPVRWCAEGFQYDGENRPGKSIFYHAGLFYIQEPSAMSPASLLAAKPGERVLDLCAAPGGKSAQLAAQMKGEGVLVANDVSASRCRALVKNLELAGAVNAVVLNEPPKRLVSRFEGFFDRVLVDAPCSGEGMFRKDSDAARSWTTHKPGACSALQREVLHYAAAMLKPGGKMAYSTCTFNPHENEAMLKHFLENHKDFELLPIDHASLGVEAARPEWGGGEAVLRRAARIWPHKAEGEGHFVSLMVKAGTGGDSQTFSPPGRVSRQALDWFKHFCLNNLQTKISGYFTQHGQALYVTREVLPDLSGMRVARSGWYLGDILKDRFEPSQALAMGLRKTDALYTADLGEADALRYLKGESLDSGESAEKCWVLVCVNDYPLGWGRMVAGRLKNKLPQGWHL